MTRTLFLVVLGIGIIGCGKKGEIEKFGGDLRRLTDDISRTINSQPTTYGVIQANQEFAAQRTQLLKEWTELKTAKLGQKDKDALLTIVVDCRGTMRQIGSDHLAEQHSSSSFNNALTLLQDGFFEYFNPEDIH